MSIVQQQQYKTLPLPASHLGVPAEPSMWCVHPVHRVRHGALRMRSLTRGGGSFRKTESFRDCGMGGGISASPALLAELARMLRSAASWLMPSSAACLERMLVGERSGVACTQSNRIVPVSHLHA